MDRYHIDGHKLYWHLDRVLEWQRGEIIPPIYVEVSPVGFCNHRCVFCGVDFAMVQNKGSMLDTGVICKRLEEMGRMGIRSIMFAGEGEPLLHRDIKQIIRRARESGIDLSLTTNGSRGDYRFWKDILPYLTWMRFSVDAGSPDVYSKVHGISGSLFERTVDNIKDAVKAKKKYSLDVTIGVQYLLVEENLEDIENAIILFSDMMIDYISLKPYSFNPLMKKKKDVIYTKETIEFIQDIVDRYKDRVEVEILFRRYATERYMERKNLFTHCHALPFYGYLASNGDFYTCKEFIGDRRFLAGNIYEDNIEDILFGGRRKDSIDYGKRSLSVKNECRTNCRMARVNEFLKVLDNRPGHVNFI